MTDNYPDWLSNQMIKGVRGFNIDAYLVALEGWRRGLELTWYYDAKDVTDLKIIGFNPLGKTFSLSSKDKTHFFYRSRGDQVTNERSEERRVGKECRSRGRRARRRRKTTG